MAMRVGLQSRRSTGNEEKMIDVATTWEGMCGCCTAQWMVLFFTKIKHGGGGRRWRGKEGMMTNGGINALLSCWTYWIKVTLGHAVELSRRQSDVQDWSWAQDTDFRVLGVAYAISVVEIGQEEQAKKGSSTCGPGTPIVSMSSLQQVLLIP